MKYRHQSEIILKLLGDSKVDNIIADFIKEVVDKVDGPLIEVDEAPDCSREGREKFLNDLEAKYAEEEGLVLTNTATDYKIDQEVKYEQR